MQQWLEQLFQQIRDHGTKLLAAAVFTILGWGVGRWRARRAWQRRDFLNRLNFSLNILQDGKLLIRTLMETSCEDVFLNQSATERVLSSAKKTPFGFSSRWLSTAASREAWRVSRTFPESLPS